MYQSHIYLEVRILLSSLRNVFVKENDSTYSIDESVLDRVLELSCALGCKWKKQPFFEKLTNPISAPKELNLTELSLLIAENGHFEIEFHGRKKSVRIEELRIEEDCGRLTRTTNSCKMDYTYAGSPSIRIKTNACFELGEEAFIFLAGIERLLRYLEICKDVPLSQAIRCNAYVALSSYPDLPTYSVKLRNLNSFNFARKAINSELSRQEYILVSGGTVKSESRLWNERQNITQSYKLRPSALQNNFESATDSCGNKITLKTCISEEYIAKEMSNLSKIELPNARCKRICQQYGLSKSRGEFICDERKRANFFEETVASGADSMLAAHWISSELKRIQHKNPDLDIYSKLTPAFFTRILQMFSAKKINSNVCRLLIEAVAKTGENPNELLKKNNWSIVTEPSQLSPLIKEVIAQNPLEAEKIKNGEMSPLEFLTGIVMEKTNGKADPITVKSMLKNELQVSIVYVLSLGGAISSSLQKEGLIVSNTEKLLCDTLKNVGQDIRYKVISLSQILSEEIEPHHYASLIAEISNIIANGTANGIVVTHGTSTLPYTAALLFWLFSDSNVPIVLTASFKTPEESSEAKENLFLAMQTAKKEQSGVYVAFANKIFSPLNLKLVKSGKDGFVNWNLKTPIFTNSGPLAIQFAGYNDLDCFVLKQILNEAADSMMVCKVYPGLRIEYYTSMIENGVKNFILELYTAGNGSTHYGDYSLKPLLQKGRKNDCRFICTSQQENIVDFSDNGTSRYVWREGAIPMGNLTTESTVALYFAAYLASDTQEEFDSFIETYAEIYGTNV